MARGGQLDDLVLVDPGLDARPGHAEADAVPALLVEILVQAGLVLDGHFAVDHREPDDRAAPAAEDERQRGVAHREGQGAEKVFASTRIASRVTS